MEQKIAGIEAASRKFFKLTNTAVNQKDAMAVPVVLCVKRDY